MRLCRVIRECNAHCYSPLWSINDKRLHKLNYILLYFPTHYSLNIFSIPKSALAACSTLNIDMQSTARPAAAGSSNSTPQNSLRVVFGEKPSAARRAMRSSEPGTALSNQLCARFARPQNTLYRKANIRYVRLSIAEQKIYYRLSK